MGKFATSHVELYARQTSTVMSIMRDLSIPPTPQMRSLLPAETVMQVSPQPSSKPPSGKSEKQDKVEQEVRNSYPSFTNN